MKNFNKEVASRNQVFMSTHCYVDQYGNVKFTEMDNKGKIKGTEMNPDRKFVDISDLQVVNRMGYMYVGFNEGTYERGIDVEFKLVKGKAQFRDETMNVEKYPVVEEVCKRLGK